MHTVRQLDQSLAEKTATARTNGQNMQYDKIKSKSLRKVLLLFGWHRPDWKWNISIHTSVQLVENHHNPSPRSRERRSKKQAWLRQFLNRSNKEVNLLTIPCWPISRWKLLLLSSEETCLFFVQGEGVDVWSTSRWKKQTTKLCRFYLVMKNEVFVVVFIFVFSVQREVIDARTTSPWKLCCYYLLFFVQCPRSGVLRTQKLKIHTLRTQSSKGLPSKLGVGQYIAMHAGPTARNFLLANFDPPGPFICTVFKTSPGFFLC